MTDVDASGEQLPAIGNHVACRRRSDGTRVSGVVEENRAGLFLMGDDGARRVLTASLWDVVASSPRPTEDPA